MSEPRVSRDSGESRTDWYLEAVLFSALVLLSLVLRVIRLDTSLWEDEVRTYQGASLPLGETFIHRTQFLYYVLAHFALKLGDSEFTLRLPSVFAGVAGVAALYGFVRQVAGRTNAWLAAFILAISAYHVDKSQEARFYAIVILSNILTVWSLWRAVSSDSTKAWIAFALAANLGIAAQFTMVPYVASATAAAAFWILWLPRGAHETKRSRQCLHLIMAASLGFASLLVSIAVRGIFPFMIASPSKGPGGSADGEVGSATAATLVNAYRLLPGQYAEFLYSYVPRYGTWIGFVLLFVVAVGVIALCKRSPLTAYLMAAQLVLVPLPLFFLYLSHWYHERYFCSVYPYYPLLTAMGCTFLFDRATAVFVRAVHTPDRARRLKKISIALCMAVFVLGYGKISSTDLIHHYSLGGIRDWKTVVHYLAPLLEPGDTIAIAAPADYSTQHLPKYRQVFPTSHIALEYYLSRELGALRRSDGAPLPSEIQIVGAGSQRQIQALTNEEPVGQTYLIALSFREPERAPHEDLDRLPTIELTRATGLVLRKLLPPGSAGSE